MKLDKKDRCCDSQHFLETTSAKSKDIFLDRRQFVVGGGKAAFFLLSSVPLLAKTPPINPNILESNLAKTGYIQVKGRCFVNNYPIIPTQGLFKLSEFIVPPKSELIFYTADLSTFKIKGSAMVTFDFRIPQFTQITLKSGSLTSVIMPDVVVPYILKTESLGIRLLSSVSFFQKSSPDQAYVDEKGEPITMSKNPDFYFCLCNGHADFLSLERKRNLKIIESSYHESMLVYDKDKKLTLEKFPRMNHMDLEQYNQIILSKSKSYPTDWLKL